MRGSKESQMIHGKFDIRIELMGEGGDRRLVVARQSRNFNGQLGHALAV